MSAELTKVDNLQRMSRKNAPPLGQYRWVRYTEDDKEVEELFCATHLASNHVVFSKSDSNYSGTSDVCVRYRDLESRTRVEPEPEKVIGAMIAAKQIELQSCIKAMVDRCREADLIVDKDAPQTMLPSTTRRDPKATKKSLLKLKTEDHPAATKQIEQITKEMVALQKDLFLPLKAQAQQMNNIVAGVDKRLFALELYAGLGQDAICIRKGKPAEPETPVAVRQMLRFIDEETLIDYDKGGMDYKSIADFDRWVAKDENLERMAPEQRCVVAFQVRRHAKDYGRPLDLCHAFSQMKEHEANQWTYLLIRNGTTVWRLAADIEFSPRLVPLRSEFADGFTETEHKSNFGNVPFGETKNWTEEKTIGPDDLNYDDHVETRMNKIYEYNRVMFLIQGLLDRSKCFSPHPPINLADGDHVDRYFKAVYDEELGLPSSNPPNWEEYRDRLNKTIKVGDWVWCNQIEERIIVWNRFGKWEKPHPSETRPRICQVAAVMKDGKHIKFRWSLGEKIKDEWVIDKSRPVEGKPGYYRMKKIEHNLGERFAWQKVELENCFAVEAYKLGDFKTFLCDAYLKGEYLQWAPQLLASEKWHNQRNKETKQ